MRRTRGIAMLLTPLNAGPMSKAARARGREIGGAIERRRAADGDDPRTETERAARRRGGACGAPSVSRVAEFKPRGLEASPDLLPVLAREAALGGFAFIVDIGQPEGGALFEERLAQFDGLVIAIAESRHDLSIRDAVAASRCARRRRIARSFGATRSGRIRWNFIA